MGHEDTKPRRKQPILLVPSDPGRTPTDMRVPAARQWSSASIGDIVEPVSRRWRL